MAKKRAADPVDVIMGVLAIILLLTLISWYYGWGIYVTTIVAGAFAYGYTKAPRRTYPTAADIAQSSDLTGKVALVTGATSGIGVDTARVLALQGAHVYIAARNPKKMQETKDELLKTLPQGSKITLLTCDLSDLDSVRACAKEFLQKEDKLHMLINNAGIMALPERVPTNQGLESQVGVCHVAHFYLTQLLMPALEKAATKNHPARLVVLSSSAHAYHDIEKMLKSPKLETDPYDAQTGYGNAKGSNILFAYEFHNKFFKTKHIAAFSVMPGGIFTGLQGHVSAWKMFKWTVVAPFFFKSIEQGAATSMVCALTADPDVDGGEYFDNCKATDKAANMISEVGKDAPSQLWTATEKLLADLGY